MDHTRDHLDLGETAVLELPCACARTHTNREIARNAKLRDKMFEHPEHSGVRKKVILKEDKRVRSGEMRNIRYRWHMHMEAQERKCVYERQLPQLQSAVGHRRTHTHTHTTNLHKAEEALSAQRRPLGVDVNVKGSLHGIRKRP